MIARARSMSRTSTTTRKSKAPLYSTARNDDRDPQRIDDVLRRWVRDQGVEAEIGAGGLAAMWNDIVGVDLAGHVTPDGVTTVDGARELLLRADSTAWATQVRLLAPQILARIREALGPDIVDRLRVVGPAPPQRATGPRRVPGPGPRDTYG